MLSVHLSFEFTDLFFFFLQNSHLKNFVSNLLKCSFCGLGIISSKLEGPFYLFYEAISPCFLLVFLCFNVFYVPILMN